jgi:antitoxin component of RelBE/YafQ-DinJ toxin-antitoxin module
VKEMPMAQVQVATRIDARVKKAVEELCEARGLKMNRFIEEALIDKLEELEDIEDLKRIRFEPTRPLSAILKDLKLDGKL